MPRRRRSRSCIGRARVVDWTQLGVDAFGVGRELALAGARGLAWSQTALQALRTVRLAPAAIAGGDDGRAMPVGAAEWLGAIVQRGAGAALGLDHHARARLAAARRYLAGQPGRADGARARAARLPDGLVRDAEARGGVAERRGRVAAKTRKIAARAGALIGRARARALVRHIGADAFGTFRAQ